MYDLYGHGLGYSGRPLALAGRGPQLGLEEGQVNLTCGPGMAKVYLQEFPWEKCVPESELETPVERPAAEPAETVPDELEPVLEPEPLPELEPEYRPPGKARFLEINPETGGIVDPDTGEPIKPQAVFFVTPAVETAGKLVGVLAVTGLVLLGLFSSSRKGV